MDNQIKSTVSDLRARGDAFHKAADTIEQAITGNTPRRGRRPAADGGASTSNFTSSGRGGRRPGAGRPRGSGKKKSSGAAAGKTARKRTVKAPAGGGNGQH